LSEFSRRMEPNPLGFSVYGFGSRTGPLRPIINSKRQIWNPILISRWTMSVSGISSSNSLSQSMQAWQARAQKIQNEFQQLGQDLQAGKLTQAQSDFSTLSKNILSPSQSNRALSPAFSALGTALQSGGLAVAQKAYTALQQGVQQAGHGQHRHHPEDNSQTTNASTGGSLSQLFASLGSALQSGNLSAAQTAYSSLEQGLTQFDSSSGTSSQSVAGVLSMLG